MGRGGLRLRRLRVREALQPTEVRSKGPVRVLLTARSGAVPADALDLPRPGTLRWSPEFSGAVAARVFTL
ncbi:hypothetical protein [Streptomyces sp. NBC_01408]|uniref:hypothetical protein n=1 Tax=Streptomyces sp. NBC_01408 TaxID=2903855 RepID=UPI00224F769E|nr:hypothetical protein [Streptomyces sp. NBC_01408]MCX4695380.1 hypothetical protein [Streptomyces sp. NBC_01408]